MILYNMQDECKHCSNVHHVLEVSDTCACIQNLCVKPAVRKTKIHHSVCLMNNQNTPKSVLFFENSNMVALIYVCDSKKV